MSTLLAPYLVAAFPVIYLAAANPQEDIGAFEIVAPILAIWLGVAALTLVLRAWLKDSARAAAAALILVVALYGYGAAYNLLPDVSAGGFEPFRHRTLFPAVLLLTAGCLWYLRSKAWSWEVGLRGVSVASLVILGFNVVRMVSATGGGSAPELPAQIKAAIEQPRTRSSEQPDIYYLLFDGYTSAGTLRAVFGFDNSDFLGALEQRGFQVLGESRSNHVYTEYSLKTTFNMQHIHEMAVPEIKRFLGAHDGLRKRAISIESTAVARLAKAMGYEIVAKNTSRPEGDGRSFNLPGAMFSPLSELVFDTTALIVKRELFEGLWRLGYGSHNLPQRAPGLLSAKDGSGPNFTFIYSAPPHPPYILKPDGTLKPDVGPLRLGNIWVPREGYVDQVAYVNSVIIELVDQILARSQRDPIIIIQGDHGPSSTTGEVDLADVSNPSEELISERTSILNVMHLPETCSESPAVDMTSVNTFRFIFNSCFGMSFDMLRDESFYVYGHGHQYDFRLVRP